MLGQSYKLNDRLGTRRVLAAAIALVALLFPGQTALACATCLCGDPTLTSMGVEKPFPGRTRISIEYLNRGETVGLAGLSQHEIDEERLTYSLSYAPNGTWIIAASLPLVTKEVQRFDLSREQASGQGDLDLSARWVVGDDPHFPKRQLWGLQFGLRLPTSEEQHSNGEAVDFDAQPGAGATIPAMGIWSGWYRAPWFFYLSANYQHATDEGYQGYQAGDVALITGHTQYALHPSVALQFSLDARWKASDSYSDIEDPDSGGMLVMASPGVAWTPFTDLIISATYQHAIAEDLNGRQEEDPVLRMGVTYDF